jgi:hypothetical protein
MTKLDTVSRLYAEYGPMLASAKPEVAHSALLANVDLTPTQIASKLSEQIGRRISNREVNLALEKLGLQKKINSSRGKWQWELTEGGKQYARVYMATSAHSEWSGNQIKWSEAVIDLLKQHFLS